MEVPSLPLWNAAGALIFESGLGGQTRKEVLPKGYLVICMNLNFHLNRNMFKCSLLSFKGNLSLLEICLFFSKGKEG